MLKYTKRGAEEASRGSNASTPRSASRTADDTSRKKWSQVKASKVSKETPAPAAETKSKAGSAPSTKNIVSSESAAERRTRLLSSTATVGDVKKAHTLSRPHDTVNPNPIACMGPCLVRCRSCCD